MKIDYLPHAAALQGRDLARTAVAVIDVLRATTTLTAALAAGASEVVPAASVAAARTLAARLRARGRAVVLAGERGGIKLPDFDRGNSPLEFTRGLRGRTVVLATSNGTRALDASRSASYVVAVCLNNLTAAAALLAARSERRLVIAGAGEADAWSEEDSLTAGLLLRALSVQSGGRVRPARDFSRAAKTVYALAARLTPRQAARAVMTSPHGRELRALGFSADLRYCGRLDTTRIVGRLSGGRIVKTGKIKG